MSEDTDSNSYSSKPLTYDLLKGMVLNAQYTDCMIYSKPIRGATWEADLKDVEALLKDKDFPKKGTDLYKKAIIRLTTCILIPMDYYEKLELPINIASAIFKNDFTGHESLIEENKKDIIYAYFKENPSIKNAPNGSELSKLKTYYSLLASQLSIPEDEINGLTLDQIEAKTSM